MARNEINRNTFCLRILQKKNSGWMPLETILKLSLTIVFGSGGLFALLRWVKEYSLNLRLEQFKVLQVYRDRFRNDPTISKVHAFIQAHGKKPGKHEIFCYLGQFEEIQFLVDQGLMRPEIAFAFFGTYASNAVQTISLSPTDDWTHLRRFVTAYQTTRSRNSR